MYTIRTFVSIVLQLQYNNVTVVTEIYVSCLSVCPSVSLFIHLFARLFSGSVRCATYPFVRSFTGFAERRGKRQR